MINDKQGYRSNTQHDSHDNNQTEVAKTDLNISDRKAHNDPHDPDHPKYHEVEQPETETSDQSPEHSVYNDPHDPDHPTNNQ